MSGTTVALQEIADRIDRPGRTAAKQLEAFVAAGRRDRDPGLSRATSSTSCPPSREGIGIRVIRDGRTGFAYAGTLDEAAVAEVLAEARDNVQIRNASTSSPASQSPTGSNPPIRSLWNEELASVRRPTKKIDLAKELEKLATGADPRVRVDEARTTPTPGVRRRSPPTTGIRQAGRENGCYVSRVHPRRRRTRATDAETQTGFGFSVGNAHRPSSTSTGRLGRPPIAQHDCSGPPSPSSKPAHDRGPRPDGDGAVPRRHLLDAERRIRREGPIALRVTVSERRSPRPMRHARRRSDEPAGLHGDRRRRRGAGGPTQRPDRGRSPASSSCTTATRPAAPAAASTGNAVRGGFAGTPGVGCLALSLVPGARSQEETRWQTSTTGSSCRAMQGLHSGREPGQRGLLHGRRGAVDPGTAPLGAPGARVHDRFDACSGCCSTSWRSVATSTGCRCGPLG